jgi:hypothetical protein
MISRTPTPTEPSGAGFRDHIQHLGSSSGPASEWKTLAAMMCRYDRKRDDYSYKSVATDGNRKARSRIEIQLFADSRIYRLSAMQGGSSPPIVGAKTSQSSAFLAPLARQA